MKRSGILLCAVLGLAAVAGCGASGVPVSTGNTVEEGRSIQIEGNGVIRQVVQYVGGKPSPHLKWVIQGPEGRYMLTTVPDPSFYTDGLEVYFKVEILSPVVAPDSYGLMATLVELKKLP